MCTLMFKYLFWTWIASISHWIRTLKQSKRILIIDKTSTLVKNGFLSSVTGVFGLQ